MKRPSLVMALLLVLTACAGESSPPTSTTRASTTSGPSNSTTEVTTTTVPTPSTTLVVPLFDRAQLPDDGVCKIDAAPVGGEATVLVGDRLYGLGADGSTPRCLAEGIVTADLEWGPLGDRLRAGQRVLGLGAIVTLDQLSPAGYEWTAPTGSRMVVFSPDRVLKVDLPAGTETNITFLQETEAISYHPAGTDLLAIGTDSSGQYGVWFASNDGVNFTLIAFDEGAVVSDPAWSWLGEPLFVASHFDGHRHIHRVDITEDGMLEGPVLVDAIEPIDMLTTARHDPVMFAYRLGGAEGSECVDGSRAIVNGVDAPEPLLSLTSTPIGWLSKERLLVLAYPDGCDQPADLWAFSAGFCPGSVYGAELLITGVDGAAAREAAPEPPPPPDFGGLIDPAPA